MKGVAESTFQPISLPGMGSEARPLLPVENPTRPFWRTELDELDDLRTTPELPEKSDIVIVGAGYAGVTLAYYLTKLLGERNQSYPAITVLEARQVCAGATGRNGGHLRPDLYGQIPMYLKRYGAEAAAEVANFEVEHVQALKDLLAEENIDCDLNITRNMNVYLNEAAGQKAKETVDLLASQGLKFVDDIYYTSEKNAEGVSGVKGAKACLSYTAGSLWPYKFILGLLSKFSDSPAVNVQTRTPVTSVETDEAGHVVNTPRGSVRATKVVYTSNAYTAGLLPEYAASIIPCRGICCHITVPEEREAPFLPYSYILNAADGQFDSYLTTRPNGSIIVGGAGYTFQHDKKQWYNMIDDSTLIEPTKHYYDDYMQRTFKGWEDTGAYVKEIWTGIMGYSADTSPHVGEVPGRKGQYMCAGFNGHGMPVVLLSAKGLAEIIQSGKSYEEVHLPRVFKTTAERLQKAQDGPEGGDILNPPS